MDNDITRLFQPLSPAPVAGVSLAGLTLLRLDQLGGVAQGNKLFKLRENLRRARREGYTHVLSFGGNWSNHLHALAWAAREEGLAAVGVVRGGERDTAMLADARRWGMVLHAVSRGDYRRRHEPGFQQQLAAQYPRCWVIPEGGDNREGVLGCLAIAALITRQRRDWQRVMLPVGTGTTLAGLVSGLPATTEVVGIAALRGADDLELRVRASLRAAGLPARARWHIRHDAHEGGFARTSAALRAFMLEFEAVHRVPLEPVYTGKLLYAAHRLLAQGELPATGTLLVHTGGLQGRRGFDWLQPPPTA